MEDAMVMEGNRLSEKSCDALSDGSVGKASSSWVAPFVRELAGGMKRALKHSNSTVYSFRRHTSSIRNADWRDDGGEVHTATTAPVPTQACSLGRSRLQHDHHCAYG